MKSKTVPMRDADGYESLEPVAGKPLPAEIVLPAFDEQHWLDYRANPCDPKSKAMAALEMACRERQLKESMERERHGELKYDLTLKAHDIWMQRAETAEAVIAELRAVPESLEELLWKDDDFIEGFCAHEPIREGVNRRIQAAEKVGFKRGLEAAAKEVVNCRDRSIYSDRELIAASIRNLIEKEGN